MVRGRAEAGLAAPVVLGYAVEFLVNQGHQLLQGVLIALGPGRKQARDVSTGIHGCTESLDDITRVREVLVFFSLKMTRTCADSCFHK